MQVHELVSQYDKLPLECDGLTRVISYVLTQHSIKHTCYAGTIIVHGKLMEPHFWIMLDENTIVDYRIRMWFGNETDAPHGVFTLSDNPHVKYHGNVLDLHTSKQIFDILTQGVIL